MFSPILRFLWIWCQQFFTRLKIDSCFYKYADLTRMLQLIFFIISSPYYDWFIMQSMNLNLLPRVKNGQQQCIELFYLICYMYVVTNWQTT